MAVLVIHSYLDEQSGGRDFQIRLIELMHGADNQRDCKQIMHVRSARDKWLWQASVLNNWSPKNWAAGLWLMMLLLGYCLVLSALFAFSPSLESLKANSLHIEL